MSYIVRLLPLLLVFYTAHAQPTYFRHYQVENGLSNNSVFCSAQDTNGFMWFGTKDGLNRFDGYRFKVFNINDGNESGLTGDQITSLAVDKKGVLWVGLHKGLYRFDAQKERLVPFICSMPDINELFLDKSGQLWFTSGFTLHRYNSETKRTTVFPADRFFITTSICQADDGNMWFSTNDGRLMRFDETKQIFTPYDVFTHSPSPASKWIEKIAKGEQGSIYIGTSSQGIKQFDTRTAQYKDVLINNPDKTNVYVRDILQASDRTFWFGTESGIFVLDAETGKLTNLKKKYLDPYSLSDNAIYTLHKDNEGGIWAGTFFGGINYFPKQSSSFQKYFPDYSPNSISGSAVREICGDGSGHIWIGTEDAGLNKLNPKTGQFTHFQPSGSSTDVAYSNIHGLMIDHDKLWIGTFEHGLDIMDIHTGKVIKHYVAGPGTHDLKSNFIVSLLKTRSGAIYLGSSSSLHRYLPRSDNFELAPDVQPNIFVSSLLEDHQGTIWTGTHAHGIYFFNPITKEKGHYVNDPANKNSLTTNTINALYEDSYHNLWFATEGGGLCRFSKNNKQFTRYTTATGLPSNFVFKVLEDNKKILWATTSKGLVKLDLTGNKTTVFTKANGLLNDQFNYNSGYKDEDGKLYFGSVKGMITFRPDRFSTGSFVPPVYITGFQVHNKELEINKDTSVLKKSIVYTRKITLPFDQSSFSIDFAAISFMSPEVTGYSYIMEGLDRDWINIGSNRKVYFTNLEPGTYTFKLKTNNSTGKEGGNSLKIEILPPFWATRWAYLVYIVLGALLFYYLTRIYHNILINRKEKEIYEAKIDFFTNIAHEIRTPLTLIKGPVENLSEMVHEVPEIREDVATMERNTARLVNLISQILDFRQTEAKSFSLSFSSVNMNDVLKETFLTFEPVAKKRKLKYSIDLPPANTYIMADDEALNKIFSNLFSNAVKYAAKEVMIKMLPNKNQNYLLIEVMNDGFLIPDDKREKIFEPFYRLKETMKQKGTGIGLSIARSLVELHKGKLFISDVKEVNVFVVRLPFTHSRIEKETYKNT